MVILDLSGFAQQVSCRNMKDTIGFASRSFQMDTIMQRITRKYTSEYAAIRKEKDISGSTACRVVICPHDDYAYAGSVYPLALENVKASVVLLFGVAHGISMRNKLIFDRFSEWKSTYGNVKISPLRDEIISLLPKSDYIVSDSLHAREHSLEALVPFLQFYNRNVEIIPILVTNMPVDTLQAIAERLAAAIQKTTSGKNLIWGNDFAIAISNDAVHYGDEGWGGKNNAPFGNDTVGYTKAIEFERTLINDYLTPKPDVQKVKLFIPMLINQKHEYKWTWCGRNSVPFGLFTALSLQKSAKTPELEGTLMRYSTSISQEPIHVNDIRMGVTAPANIHHWVGYAAIVYK